MQDFYFPNFFFPFRVPFHFPQSRCFSRTSSFCGTGGQRSFADYKFHRRRKAAALPGYSAAFSTVISWCYSVREKGAGRSSMSCAPIINRMDVRVFAPAASGSGRRRFRVEPRYPSIGEGPDPSRWIRMDVRVSTVAGLVAWLRFGWRHDTDHTLPNNFRRRPRVGADGAPRGAEVSSGGNTVSCISRGFPGSVVFSPFC